MANENAAVEELGEKAERKQYNVSSTEFVQAWEEANSAQEVSDKLDMPKNIVLARSAVYRKRGVKLKKMPRNNPRKLDVDFLNSLTQNGQSNEVEEVQG